jgi:hypothetical protein
MRKPTLRNEFFKDPLTAQPIQPAEGFTGCAILEVFVENKENRTRVALYVSANGTAAGAAHATYKPAALDSAWLVDLPNGMASAKEIHEACCKQQGKPDPPPPI